MTQSTDEKFLALVELMLDDNAQLPVELLGLIPPEAKALALLVQRKSLLAALELASRGAQQGFGAKGAFAVHEGRAVSEDFKIGWRACALAIGTRIENTIKELGADG